MHVKKGDTVIVIAGKERGMKGQVLKVLRDESKVIVEGRNLVKRHHKPNPLIGREGGIIEREAPIHVSNVMLYSDQGKDRSGNVVGGGVRVQSRYVGSDGSLFATKAEAIKSYDNPPARLPKVRYAPKTGERFE